MIAKSQILVTTGVLVLAANVVAADRQGARQAPADGIIHVEGHIVAADVPSSSRATIEFGKAIAKASPPYPVHARAQGVTGVVIVIAHVTAGGTVDSAEVRWPSQPDLEQAAKGAAKGWRFTVTRADGQAVPAFAQLTFDFR